LKADSLKVIVNYVKSLSSRFQNEQSKQVKMSSQISSSEKVLRMEKLFSENYNVENAMVKTAMVKM